jgi:hypothetical protein
MYSLADLIFLQDFEKNKIFFHLFFPKYRSPSIIAAKSSTAQGGTSNPRGKRRRHPVGG